MMMSTETFDVVIRGVHYTVKEETLKDLFSNCGEVIKCVMLPRNPKFDTVMAFIGYGTRSECDDAVSKFNNFKLRGQKLIVQVADKKGHSKNSPDRMDNQNARGKSLGMGRGGSPLMKNNGPATFIPPQPRPALLKTPPKHMRLPSTKTSDEDSIFGSIEQIPSSDNAVGARRPRMSEPPMSQQFNLRSRMAARKSELSVKAFAPTHQSVQPPSRSLKKGDRVKFYVELSMLHDLTSDMTCQSDNPLVFAELHELYSRKSGQDAFSTANPPAVSSYVAAPFEMVYFRAHVLSVGNGVVKVRFIDYGNEESLNLASHHVYPLEDRFVEMKPALFVKCRFGGSDRNLEIFEEMLRQIDPTKPQLTLDAEVLEYNEDTKLCIINMVLDEKENPSTKFTNGHVNHDIESLINFPNYLNRETICFPREVPTPDLIIFTPKYLKDKIEEFDALVDGCKIFDSSPKQFQVGEMVCAPYKDIWFRAIIRKVEGDKADVYFIDYGNKDIISIDQLKRFGQGCPARILNEQAYAVPCKIAGIKPRGGEDYSDECMKEMCDYLDESELFIQGIDTTYDPIFEGTVLVVNLSSKDIPSFADHLIEKEFADRIETKVTKSRSPKAASQNARSPNDATVLLDVEPPMKIRQRVPMLTDLDKNKYAQQSTSWVSISMVSYDSILDFCGVPELEKEKLDSLTVSLCEVYSKKPAPFPHADLKIGALVVAYSSQCEGFYRGSILRFTIAKSKVEVFYLDYGNKEIISLDQIFPIQENFLEPPLGIFCALKDASKEDCTTVVDEEAREILGNSPKISIKVEETMKDENPAIPARAVVDMRVGEGNFGSKRLVSMLGIATSSPNTPLKPTVVSQSTPQPTAVSKPRVTPPSAGDAVSNNDSTHANLIARIKQLEDKQAESNNRIFQLERLVYSLLDMTATSMDDKEDA